MSEAPAWETSKENVLPVKRGRSAKGLCEALAKPPIHDDSDAVNQEQRFENQLKTCPSDQPLTKFELYCQYLKWTRDTYPGTKDKVLTLLERCTEAFQNVAELKNNEKYIAIWIEYADSVKTPGEIFTHMHQNKIGATVALFWIAWAYVAEKALNYKLADDIYQRGTRTQAEPKKVLADRYKQYQRRMARLFLNSQGDGESESGSAGSIDEAVTAAAMQAIRSAPAVTSAPAPTTEGSAPAGGRRALNAVEQQGSIAAHRPDTAPAQARLPQGSTGSRAKPAAPAGPAKPQGNAGKAAFQIFSDNPTPAESSRSSAAPVASTAKGAAIAALAPHLYEPHLDDAGTDANPLYPATWGTLGTEAQRRKENEGPVTKWSQGPLLAPSAALPAAPTALMQPQGPAISVFVDPEFSAPEPQADHEDKDLGTVLSVRKQLDETERIARNPLARHAKAIAAVAAPAPVPVPAAAEELPVFISAAPPPVPAVVAPVKTRSTSSTLPAAPASTGASTATFSIFCDNDTASAVKPASSKPAAGVTSKPSSGFSAFDVSSSPRARAASASATSSAAALPPAPKATQRSVSSAAPSSATFSIFEDLSFTAPAALPVQAPFAIFQDEPPSQAAPPAAAATVSSKPAFDIYSDSPQPSEAAGSSALIPSAATVATPVAPAEEEGDQEHEGELNAILADMICLDGEDGTINTRLAKRDIDMMFCSPTIHRAPPPPSTRAPAATSTAVASTLTANRIAPGTAGDENSFCLPPASDRQFGRALFRAHSGEDSGGEADDHCASFIAGGGGTGAGPGTSRTATKKPLQLAEDSPGVAAVEVPGVLHRAAHRPFGVQLDQTMSAVMDLSAIKESSHEYSLCGLLMETPGNTGTLGFGRSRGRRLGTAPRDSNCGGMLADMSSYGPADLSHGSRDSFAAPPTPAAGAAFEIFSDQPPTAGAAGGKRGGGLTALPEGDAYYAGIDADALLSLPSRRRLYNPFLVGKPSHSVSAASSQQQELQARSRKRKSTAIAERVAPGSAASNQSVTEFLSAPGAFQTTAAEMFTSQRQEECAMEVVTSEETVNLLKVEKAAGGYKPSLDRALSAAMFYSLDALTFSALLERLRAHNAATKRILLTHQPHQRHPPCFSFRAKPNTTARTPLPHSPGSWAVVGNIGRGTYGHAILMQAEGSGERRVFKVDTDRDSVVWEAHMHAQLQQRLAATAHSQPSVPVRTLYQEHVVAPTALLVYSDCAVLELPFSQWGTLVTALTVLAQGKSVFSPQEHEALCVYLAQQMVAAVLSLHALGVLHCDIKTDNWVLGDAQGGTGTAADVRVRLIDFGRSLSALHYGEHCPGQQQGDAPEGEYQAAVLLGLYPASAAVDHPGMPVEYHGDVSCKSYQCLEMQRGEPWSYQNDLFGLCSCIHQLLHLQPMSCSQEHSSRLSTRGLEAEHALMTLRGAIKSAGTSAQAAAFGDVVEYTVPLGSLKRYWDKPLWSVVYLLLLNAAQLIPTQLNCSVAAGAAPLLQVVHSALQEYAVQPQNIPPMQRAVHKLQKGLREREV